MFNWLATLWNGFWRCVNALYKLVVVLGVLLIALAIWTAMKGSPPVPIEDNVALVIAPSGHLVERLEYESSLGWLETIAGEPPSETC